MLVGDVPADVPAVVPALRSRTSEPEWHAWSRAVPPWSPPPAPTVVVAPHPDDETFGDCGVIAAQRRRDLPVTVVAVTDGEAAYANDAGLAATRTLEQEVALGFLGGGRVERLRIPDGDVGRHEPVVTAALSRWVAPGALLVAPFERDGHPDHDACGRAALHFARRTGTRLARYPIRAWHWSRPEVFDGLAVRALHLAPGVRAAKAAAVAAHASQLRRRGGEPILPPDVLEHFERDWELYVLDA